MTGATESDHAERAEAFPPSDRVKLRSDFVRLQSGARRVHLPHFVVLLGLREDGSTRLGITVTRKVGNSVARNRVRRLVREVFRRNRGLFPEGHDLIVIARAGAPTLDYATVLEQVQAASGAMAAVAQKNRRAPRRPAC